MEFNFGECWPSKHQLFHLPIIFFLIIYLSTKFLMRKLKVAHVWPYPQSCTDSNTIRLDWCETQNVNCTTSSLRTSYKLVSFQSIYLNSIIEFIEFSYGFCFWCATPIFSVAPSGHPYEKKGGTTAPLQLLSLALTFSDLQQAIHWQCYGRNRETIPNSSAHLLIYTFINYLKYFKMTAFNIYL